jgi:uncharacterized BrkB/YihY/UPF0761 family membrane protein
MPAAVASLLFMGLGCISYLMHVLTDPGSLPLDQRAAYLAEPLWVTAAYAIAVWVGLAGLILVTPLRENMSANDLLVAIVAAALTWTIFWFARHSGQRDWLR